MSIADDVTADVGETIKLKLFRNGRAKQVTVEHVDEILRHPYEPPLDDKSLRVRLRGGQVITYPDAAIITEGSIDV